MWNFEILDPWEEGADFHRIPLDMKKAGQSFGVDTAVAWEGNVFAILGGNTGKWL